MMKKRNRKRISCLLSALLLLVMSIGWSVMAMADDAVNKDSSKPTVWIIGDSTVSSFADNYYYPRYGWGTQIDKYLDGTYEVKNIALSGRSSKSYVNDKEYNELTSGMKQGDYLLIGSDIMMKRQKQTDIQILMVIIRQLAHLLTHYMKTILSLRRQLVQQLSSVHL